MVRVMACAVGLGFAWCTSSYQVHAGEHVLSTARGSDVSHGVELNDPSHEVMQSIMRAWELINIARSISYTDAGMYNRDLFMRMLRVYGGLYLLHFRAAGCSQGSDRVVAELVDALEGGVRALCEVQSPDVTWPFEVLSAEIYAMVPGDVLRRVASSEEEVAEGRFSDERLLKSSN